MSFGQRYDKKWNLHTFWINPQKNPVIKVVRKHKMRDKTETTASKNSDGNGSFQIRAVS